MDHSSPSLFNGFAKFPSQGDRDRFVREVLDREPKLRGMAHVSHSRPDIVFENLTVDQMTAVKSAIGNLSGKWFEDVSFKTM